MLSFPTFSIQHWLNSRLRSLWLLVTFQPRGLSGHWVATFRLESEMHGEEREEDIIVNHLSGGELRGSIKDRHSRKRYRFQGRVVFDEIVGHYWSTDESRDIGTFKFQKSYETNKVLNGLLTVLDAKLNKTTPGIVYRWYYLPPRIVRHFRPVRQGQSLINRAGLFTNCEFKPGVIIGNLALGKACIQGKHTIKFKDKHRKVKMPWCYLNHACEPSAELVWNDSNITLKAKVHILPQTEVTIDYHKLPEEIGTPFKCNCRKCINSERQAVIGVPQQSAEQTEEGWGISGSN